MSAHREGLRESYNEAGPGQPAFAAALGVDSREVPGAGFRFRRSSWNQILRGHGDRALNGANGTRPAYYLPAQACVAGLLAGWSLSLRCFESAWRGTRIPLPRHQRPRNGAAESTVFRGKKGTTACSLVPSSEERAGTGEPLGDVAIFPRPRRARQARDWGHSAEDEIRVSAAICDGCCSI